MTTDKPDAPRLTVDQVRARVGMLLRNGCRIHGEETARPESWVVLDPAHKGGTVRYVWTEHMIGPGWEPSPECPHAALRGRIEDLLDGWADTLSKKDLLDADSDTRDFDTLAECHEHLDALLTPGPKPSTGGDR